MSDEQPDRMSVLQTATWDEIEAIVWVDKQKDKPLIMQLRDNLKEWSEIAKDRLRSIENLQAEALHQPDEWWKPLWRLARAVANAPHGTSFKLSAEKAIKETEALCASTPKRGSGDRAGFIKALDVIREDVAERHLVSGKPQIYEALKIIASYKG